MPVEKIAFIASEAEEAAAALATLTSRYGNADPIDADVIVALGGDGLMLQTIHRFLNSGIPIYGMNRGSVGFLMNEYAVFGLAQLLDNAEITKVFPLRMTVIDSDGEEHTALAFNEVSLLRNSYQAAKLRISIDGKQRLDELICDGLLVSTPAGSTAYNYSAHGPILPIDSPLLALTPISAFRPRRWRGALLPRNAKIRIEVLETVKRPVNTVADHTQFNDIVDVYVEADMSQSVDMLFNEGHSLEERVLREQFRY